MGSEFLCLFFPSAYKCSCSVFVLAIMFFPGFPGLSIQTVALQENPDKLSGLSGSNSSSVVWSEKEVRCVCDGDCERLRVTDCPWGLTLDVCGCCFLCSRGEDDVCGGAQGNCAHGLHCRQQQKVDGNDKQKLNKQEVGQGICLSN